jgi:NADH-quinone oxidoreductase subunit M
VISASVVIITAAYILWTLQRVYLGPEYKGPHGDHLHPMTSRELAIAAPLLALAIAFGVYPQAIFNYMTPSVDHTVDDLADWTRTHVPTPEQPATARVEGSQPAADVAQQ